MHIKVILYCSLGIQYVLKKIKRKQCTYLNLKVAIIKKNTNNKCWQGYGKGNPFPSCWECKLVQPLGKTVWKFLKKLKVELSYDPAIPLLSVYTEEKH